VNIDLSRFKVVYADRVLNAVALWEMAFENDIYPLRDGKSITKPKFISVLAINEDCNLIVITDETWRFQFLPITGQEGNR